MEYSEILQIAEKWTKGPFDGQTNTEIQTLIDNKEENELTDRFYRTLEFGTGGLRGKIGAGTNRINLYTVGLATQGFANYIIKKSAQKKGVVISYDSRHFSEEFARKSAEILSGNDIQVYLFNELNPTPLCSYAIRKLGATGGIMITASHNPPEYNGYKVFWDDGGQIVPPQDHEIIAEINGVHNFDVIKSTDFSEAQKSGKIRYIGEEIINDYKEELFGVLKTEGTKDLKIAYSPLHGTGYKIIPSILREAGFEHIEIVKEQSEPDGDFPTVIYPNPEETEAMSLLISLAKEKKLDIMIATDPDADRVGIGIRNDDSIILLNGNQTAVLLTDYMITLAEKAGRLTGNSTIIKTIITSELMADIAKSKGLKIENVLTGFKWIAAKMKEFEQNTSATYLFGCEESYGYLPVSFVRDKDAVAATLAICEMAEYHKQNGTNLIERLNEIFCEHAMYQEEMHYKVFEGMEGAARITKIMEKFRNNPPEKISGTAVAQIKDFSILERLDIQTQKRTPIENMPKSNVMQYILDNGNSFTIRPSGTEPKIKFYISVCKKTSQEALDTTAGELSNEIESIMLEIETVINQVG